ncbi:MAG: hypothetical protein ACJA1A_001684 [Saprospiraceae bacterium]|jgi:hypothetical protein
MKNLIHIIITLPFFASSQSAQFDQVNAIKISPVELGNAQFEMTYERCFGDRSSSLVILPSIFLKDDIRE